MRRGIPRSWTVAILCSLALSMIAPFFLSTFNVSGARPSAVAQEPSPDSELEALAPEDGVRGPSASDGLDKELEGAGAKRESFLKWLYKSLKFRYVLIFLILTFNSVALIVMIVLGLRRSSLCPDDLAAAFEAKLNQKQYQDAYELAKSDKSFLGKVLAGGMSKLSEGPEAVHEAMQEVGDEQNMKLEQRNGYIALIAQIGPMFGLLGTVDGMVIAFDKISTSPTTPKPSELAVGIGTALVTTIVGLWIAIPLMIFYHIVRNRLSRMVMEISVVSTNLMKRFESLPGSGKKG